MGGELGRGQRAERAPQGSEGRGGAYGGRGAVGGGPVMAWHMRSVLWCSRAPIWGWFSTALSLSTQAATWRWSVSVAEVVAEQGPHLPGQWGAGGWRCDEGVQAVEQRVGYRVQ